MLFDTPFNSYDNAVYPVHYWKKMSFGSAPIIGANLDGQSFDFSTVLIVPNELNFIPGIVGSGQFAVLRFTAPATGSYALAGNFDGNSTFPFSDEHILVNNVSFFDATMTRFGNPNFFLRPSV